MNNVQRKFIVDAMDKEHLLTEWEVDFVYELAERDEDNPDMVLTKKQNDVLNRIQRKVERH